MFYFVIGSSRISICICKNFIMFLGTFKDRCKRTIFLYTQSLFHYFETDVLG